MVDTLFKNIKNSLKENQNRVYDDKLLNNYINYANKNGVDGLLSKTIQKDIDGNEIRLSGMSKEFESWISTVNESDRTLDNFKKQQVSVGNAISKNVPIIDSVKNGFKSFGSAFLESAKSMALNVGVFMAISMAISLVSKGIDALIVTQEELEQTAKDSKTEYEQLKTDIENVNSELEENKERILELQSKDSLTYVEQQELEKLKTANEQLERQLKLYEEMKVEKAAEAAGTAGDTLDKYIMYGDSKERHGYNSISTAVAQGNVTDITLADKDTDIEAQIYLFDKYSRVMRTTTQSTDEWKEANERASKAKTNLVNAMSDIQTKLNDMQDGYDIVKNKSSDSLTSQEQRIKTQYEKFNKAYQQMAKTIDKEDYYSKAFDKVFSDKKINNFKDQLVELSKSGKIDLNTIKSYKDLDEQLKESNITSGYLSKTLSDNGITLGEFTQQLKGLSSGEVDSVGSLANSAETLSETLSLSKTQVENLNTALNESITTSGLGADSIEHISSMFGSLKDYDASKLFENTANGIHLNADELRKLTSEYDKNKTSQYSDKLKELKDKYKETCAELGNFNGNIANQNALIENRDTLASQIEQVEQLQSQYKGLTSAYTQWENAQSGKEDGDTYDSVVNSLKNIKDLYDKGLVGTDKFKTSVQLMTNKDVANMSIEELVQTYEKGYPKMKKYFTESSDGVLRFLKDAEKANKEWVHMNKDGSWDINVDDEKLADKMGLNVETIQQIWRKLNDYGADIDINKPEEKFKDLRDKAEKSIEAINDKEIKIDFDAKSEKDINKELTKIEKKKAEIEKMDIDPDVKDKELKALNDSAEYLTAKLGEVSSKKYDVTIENNLEELEDNLKTLQDDCNFDIEIDFSNEDPKYIQNEIEDISDVVKKLQKEDGSIDIETKGAKEARNLLIALLNKKYELSHPIVVDVDASKLSGYTKDAISDMQALQAQYHQLENLEEQKKLGFNVDADISKAESSIKTLETKFVNNHPTISAELGLKEGSIEGLKQKIQSISGEDLVAKFNVDASAINNYKPDDKNAKTKYSVDDTTVKNYTPPQKTGTVTYKAVASEQLYTWTPPTLTGRVNYKTSSNANGTAHHKGSALAKGTANVRGDWAVKNSGKSLVGELGQELIVRNGRYFTVGDNGAEFVDIKKGDVIFDHIQTRELLHGKNTSNALANGTAFATGNAYVTTGRYKKIGVEVQASKPKKKKTKTSSKRKSSSKKKSSSSSKSSTKKFLETFDWVEVAIDRVERAIDSLSLKAESTYSTWSTRNKNLSSEMSKIKTQINLNTKGYNEYIKKANSYGLSSAYKKKVQNGTIKVQDIKDEKLAEKVKNYQTWYEKAIDLKKSTEELNEELKDLQKQKFDNIIDQYEKILETFESKNGFIETIIDTQELKGFVASTKYYTELLSVNNSTLSNLQKEKTALLSSLTQALNSGYIKKNSETWYEMKKQIDDVQQSIYEAEQTAQELKNTIEEISWEKFDNLHEKISDIVEESEFLNELLDENKFFENNGDFTNIGLSSMALYGVNYNTLMKQADDYAKAIKELDEQYKNDSLNSRYLERRQELVETQRDLISNAKDERDSMIDLQSDAYDKMLDYLDELIDKRKDLLNSSKDYYEYEKEISEKTKNVNDIQKKLNAYNGDNSEEAKKTIKELKVELQEAKDDLRETEYDKYISDQEAMLDKLSSDAQTWVDERLDNIDQLLQDIIDNVNLNNETVIETIQQISKDVGYSLTDSMTEIISPDKIGEISNILSVYNDNFSETMTTVLSAINGIKTDVDSEYGKSSDEASKNVENANNNSKEVDNVKVSTKTNTSSSNNKTSSKTTTNSNSSLKSIFTKKKDKTAKSKLNRYGSIVDALKYYDYDSSFSKRKTYYQKLFNSKNYTGSSSQNAKLLKKFRSIMGYSKGGLVGELKKVAKLNNDNEISINTLKRGESVFDVKTTEQLIKFNQNSDKFANLLTFADKGSQTQVVNQYTFDGLEIVLPNVSDFNGFKNELMSDGMFQKFIFDTVDNKYSGKNKLSFKKYIK